MSKTTDELQVEVLEEEGLDAITYVYALWDLGERGNQIAQERVRDILRQLREERRQNYKPTLLHENHSG